MKKIVAGIGFEMTGTITLVFASFVAGLNLHNTTSWNTQLGRFWQTVFDYGLLPLFIIGAGLLVAGIGFSLWGVCEKSNQ